MMMLLCYIHRVHGHRRCRQFTANFKDIYMFGSCAYILCVSVYVCWCDNQAQHWNMCSIATDIANAARKFS